MGVTIDFEKYYNYTTQGCDTSGFGWLKECGNSAITTHIFKKGGKILDLGCGTGIWTCCLRKNGFEVTPCDVSNAQFEETVIGDMHNLPFFDEQYDGVFCTGTFEHSIAPFIALHEMSRVLKVGGVLYIDMPAITNLRVMNLPQHVNTQCYENMINLTRKVGFELVDYQIREEREAGTHQYYVFKKIQ